MHSFECCTFKICKQQRSPHQGWTPNMMGTFRKANPCIRLHLKKPIHIHKHFLNGRSNKIEMGNGELNMHSCYRFGAEKRNEAFREKKPKQMLHIAQSDKIEFNVVK